MSKIGKKPIVIPAGVTIKTDNNFVVVKGLKGELKHDFDVRKFKVSLVEEEGSKLVKVEPVKETNADSVLWGLLRSLINNMIIGVTEGYEKKLEIRGIGYKGAVQGKKLTLSVGYTHPVEVEAPAGIEIGVDKNIITVKGIDKQLVGQTAAVIRDQKKPEPYQGKGIRYLGENVKQKVGKKAVASTK